MNSALDDAELPAPGFPIRRSSAHSPLSGSPKLFAASHVLHRLLAPRHPPYALSSLTISPNYHLRSRSGFIYPYAIVKDRMTNPSKPWIRAVCANTRNAHPADLTRKDGADRNRTDGLRLARAALSHLSYSPSTRGNTQDQVGLGRVELPTSPLSGVRSSQLSYRPHVRQSLKTRE
jgi:hypothetical protein